METSYQQQKRKRYNAQKRSSNFPSNPFYYWSNRAGIELVGRKYPDVKTKGEKATLRGELWKKADQKFYEGEWAREAMKIIMFRASQRKSTKKRKRESKSEKEESSSSSGSSSSSESGDSDE
eukprot:TRINITY_DN10290_c0_g1_i1.p1 TRINITY_DN10290_c0_g1~~TRINITY_DN10290_c0_g1_i1.p1  ORF type:complete len:122 (+),score=28.88 TRINITY_DN10290_c0_g1_i1:385-750(+)